MKTLSNYFILLILAAMLLPGCSPNVGTWKDDQIRESKRDDLHELNDRVFAMMKAGDNKGMEDILSKELFENRNFYALAGNVGHRMVRDSFIRFEEYYTMNNYIGTDTIKAGSGSNAHKLIFPSYAQEMYIAFYTPLRKDIPGREMITAIYSKYNYGWKLSDLSIGKYAFNGKTAQELIAAAKKSYDNHYVVDALHNATLAVTCLNPSTIWTYTNDGDIREFYRKVADEANKLYKFPLVVDKVSTKPRIIGFYNKTTSDGTYPIISYLSHIPLKDTAGLNYERQQVSKALDALMPGLNKNNRYVYYLAYNQSPSGTENVKRYEMEDKHW